MTARHVVRFVFALTAIVLFTVGLAVTPWLVLAVLVVALAVVIVREGAHE